MQKKDVRDVESTLNYLLGVLSSVEHGDRQEFDEGAYAYARKVLIAAEQAIKKLGMYEATQRSGGAREPERFGCLHCPEFEAAFVRRGRSNDAGH